MAVNFLPILLVGGAAAVVVSRSSKKKEKTSPKCPPTTVITLGEMRSVAERAVAKYGSDIDPAREANYIVNEVLPPGCNRSSIESKVKIQIPDVEKGFEMSIPDIYMLTFAQSLAARADDKRIAQQEAETFWTRELDWYKKVTGTNFDIGRTGIVEFAKVILELIKNAIGKPARNDSSKSNAPDSMPKLGGCPDKISIDLESFDSGSRAIMDEDISIGVKDPFKISDKIISSLFHNLCSKSDYKSLVQITVNGESVKSINIAAFYGMIAFAVSNRLLASNLIGPAQFDVIKSKIINDYQKLTGETFPEDLGN